MLRLFVALEVPEARKASIEQAVGRLRDAVPAVPGTARWTAKGSWHVTLKFLGATPEDRLEAVRGVVASAATAGTAVQTRLTGLGAFPSPRRARVLWVGLDDAQGALASLASSLEDGFEPESFPKESRLWRPHLTLARLRVPGPVDLDAAPAVIDAEPFVIGEIVLFRSHLKPQGAVYEALERFPLGP